MNDIRTHIVVIVDIVKCENSLHVTIYLLFALTSQNVNAPIKMDKRSHFQILRRPYPRLLSDWLINGGLINAKITATRRPVNIAIVNGEKATFLTDVLNVEEEEAILALS